MKAEIITIGDELLIGQTVDTNSAWIGKQLYLIGIDVNRINSISDKKQDIINALNESRKRADFIIITGGLGPTKDDITKATLGEYFNSDFYMNEEVLEKIKAFFDLRGREMLEVNKLQALLPTKATVLPNEVGTASGMWFEDDGKVFVSMPGVPYEMKNIMENHVLPKAKKFFNAPKIIHRTILTQGIGESFLAEILADWENNLRNSNLSLAYLPSPGLVKLRISSKGLENGQKLVDDFAEQLYLQIPQYIFGEGKTSLQSILGDLLSKNNQTISTAESCTGGYISHLITSIPGSSKYYKGSTIAYAYDVKSNDLGVSADDLNSFGAVSQQVVEQMAKGIQNKMGSDFAIATSGIAGPDGGTENKPIGTVWIAIATPEKIFSKKFLFGNDRQRNVHKTAITAFNMLRKELE